MLNNVCVVKPHSGQVELYCKEMLCGAAESSSTWYIWLIQTNIVNERYLLYICFHHRKLAMAKLNVLLNVQLYALLWSLLSWKHLEPLCHGRVSRSPTPFSKDVLFIWLGFLHLSQSDLQVLGFCVREARYSVMNKLGPRFSDMTLTWCVPAYILSKRPLVLNEVSSVAFPQHTV